MAGVLLFCFLSMLFTASLMRGAEGKVAGRLIALTATGREKTSTLAILLILVYSTSEARAGLGYAAPAFSYISLLILSTLAFTIGCLSTGLCKSNTEINKIATFIAIGSTIYVFINLVALFAGYGSKVSSGFDEVGMQNKMLGLIGLEVSRIAPPFSGGLNNFAVSSSIALAFCAARFSIAESKKNKVIWSLLIITNLTGLVITDSRGAAVMLAASLLIAYATNRTRLKPGNAIMLIAIGGFVAPIIISQATPVLNYLSTIESLQREGAFANRLGVASGRDIIWSAIIGESLESPINLFFGYGAYGHFTSGASTTYAWIFAGSQEMTRISSHNTSMQLLIDSGIFGVAIWISLWIITGRMLDRLHRPHQGIRPEKTNASPLLPPLLFLLLSGYTEATCTQYSFDSLMMLLFITGAATGISLRKTITQDSIDNASAIRREPLNK